MIKGLLNFALTQRLATTALAIILIAFGIWSWITLKKEAYPDVGDTQVTIITTFPGRASVEVEQQITIPLEKVLNGVPKVIQRRSKTIFGLSVIQLTFEDGTDDYFARQRVLEKLAEAELPNGVSPTLGPLTSPVGEIFRYVIESNDNYNPMQLRTLQDWVIIPKILQVQGVADVINFGGLVKQYHVITSPTKLLKYNLTLQNVIDAINSNNLNTGGNIIKRGEQGFAIRSMGAIRNKEDLLNIVLTSQSGVPVFVKDIATVEEYPLPANGILGYTLKDANGKKEEVQSGIQGLVAMRRGENASQVVDDLKKKVDEINSSDLPEGVKLKITYDRSDLVDYTIETISHTLLEGFIIVIIVLIFFIGSVRSALVVATTIPISLLFAFTMMKFTGINANLLSLGAIDFGIIVDGAVIMVENIMRHFRDVSLEEKRMGIIHNTLNAAQEVSTEIFFSIIIIILAYLPIFTFQRVEGKLFAPMAYTLAFAILGSLLLALTIIPILMSIIYKKYFTPGHRGKIEWHNPIYEFILKFYNKSVQFLVNNYIYTVAAAGAIVIFVSIFGLKHLGTEFLPELDEGSFNIRCFFPVGINLDDAAKYTPIIRKIISDHKEVKSVITQLGRNDDGTDPYGPNRLEILVILNDYSTWIKNISKKDLLIQIKKSLETAIPGALFSFSQPILDNVTEAVTGSVADLAIQINGNDLNFMRQKADSILNIIKTIKGATEYGIEQEGDQAQLAIDINRVSAARYGINISDIQRMIEAAIGGQSIGSLYEGNKKFDIVVRYTPEYRGSIEAIKNMIVPSPTGARIPMSELATIRLIDGPTIIQREDGNRQISVRTNIRGRDQGGFVAEAKEKIKNIVFPKGYSVEWGGQFENLSRAASRLQIVVPLTLGIIFLILFILYKNIRYVTISMSSIPLALTGGILALVIRGYAFNVSSGVGFISLFGVSIMTGVLYVFRTNQLRDSGMHLKEAVVKAAVIQLRPNLMTIVLALFGLIPASMASGIGSDVQRPLATVIVGGLTSALLLTIFVMPAIYYSVEVWLNKKSTHNN
jgi:cobalt-zinc-cadmium resistance protein CzcA